MPRLPRTVYEYPHPLGVFGRLCREHNVLVQGRRTCVLCDGKLSLRVLEPGHDWPSLDCWCGVKTSEDGDPVHSRARN